MSDLIHRGCGGQVAEDWNNPYRFEGDDVEAFGEKVPRYICNKCGGEILGDAQVLIVERINLAKNSD